MMLQTRAVSDTTYRVSGQELSAIPILANLAPSDLSEISRLAQVLRVPSRQVLWREDAPFSGLHLLRTGNVKICKASGGKEQILEILGPGDVLDPVPLFDDGPHVVTAKTMGPVVLYRFAPDAARQLIADYPPVLNALLNLLSQRLRRLATLANDLAFKDVTARVCKALLDQADPTSEGTRRTRPLTRQELAALVGTAREVAWRSLKKLERDGFIRIEGHDIVILDPSALAALA